LDASAVAHPELLDTSDEDEDDAEEEEEDVEMNKLVECVTVF